jgi:hypothetical protein
MLQSNRNSDALYLKILSEKDSSAPLAEITRDSDLNVSEATVGRALRGKGLLYTHRS